MRVSVDEKNGILIEDLYVGITLKTVDGETMSICARDSGFEFEYQGEKYFAKEGFVEPFKKSIRGNYLVEQNHEEQNEVPQSKI